MQPSGEAAGAWRPPRMPESCSTVTYWAERSRLNQEKRLQARASRHRGMSRRLQPPKEGATSPGGRSAGAACRPGAGHRVRSPPALHPPRLGLVARTGSNRQKAALPPRWARTLLPSAAAAAPEGKARLEQARSTPRQDRAAPASAPCSAAAGQVPQPKREVGSEHQGTRGGHVVCSILAARDAAGNPREQTRACSGAGTSSAAGGTASKKER